MTLYTVLISVITGILTGLLYGFAFLRSRRRIFNSNDIAAFRATYFLLALASIMRIALLAILVAYLLRSPSFNFILLITFFLVGFWLVLILTRKASINERFKSF